MREKEVGPARGRSSAEHELELYQRAHGSRAIVRSEYSFGVGNGPPQLFAGCKDFPECGIDHRLAAVSAGDLGERFGFVDRPLEQTPQNAFTAGPAAEAPSSLGQHCFADAVANLFGHQRGNHIEELSRCGSVAGDVAFRRRRPDTREKLWVVLVGMQRGFLEETPVPGGPASTVSALAVRYPGSSNSCNALDLSWPRPSELDRSFVGRDEEPAGVREEEREWQEAEQHGAQVQPVKARHRH